ncbi:unnamed protein product [Effrenium voratum]|nr:unnamed protein product [Effrenium voratum]
MCTAAYHISMLIWCVAILPCFDQSRCHLFLPISCMGRMLALCLPRYCAEVFFWNLVYVVLSFAFGDLGFWEVSVAILALCGFLGFKKILLFLAVQSQSLDNLRLQLKAHQTLSSSSYDAVMLLDEDLQVLESGGWQAAERGAKVQELLAEEDFPGFSEQLRQEAEAGAFQAKLRNAAGVLVPVECHHVSMDALPGTRARFLVAMKLAAAAQTARTAKEELVLEFDAFSFKVRGSSKPFQQAFGGGGRRKVTEFLTEDSQEFFKKQLTAKCNEFAYSELNSDTMELPLVFDSQSGRVAVIDEHLAAT